MRRPLRAAPLDPAGALVGMHEIAPMRGIAGALGVRQIPERAAGHRGGSGRCYGF